MSALKFAPILRDIPESFTTERLLIRCPRPGDGPATHKAVVESLDRLLPWFPWAHRNQSPEDSEEIVRRGYARFLERTDLRLLGFRHDSGELVVSSGLHHIDWAVPKFEIGYWVRTGYEGQGYVTETVHGIAEFALTTLGANRLEIRCDPKNVRSAAVAERCGFTLEARLRNDTRDMDGHLRDTLVYARIPEKPDQRNR
jgi:RimJ/RimL family protein N-acetyltransferase